MTSSRDQAAWQHAGGVTMPDQEGEVVQMFGSEEVG